MPAMPSMGKPMGGSNTLAIIGGIIVLIIIAGVAYYALSHQSHSQLLSVLSSKNVNGTQLAKLIQEKVNASPTYSEAYSGMAFVNESGTALGGVTLTVPFTFSFMKYYNDSRSTVSLSGIPLVGNLTAVIISEDNGATTYTCDNTSLSLFGSGSGGFTCMKNQASASASGLGSLNVSQITKEISANLTINSVTTSSYDGMPCYEAIGSVSISNYATASLSSELGTNVNATFAACFSEQYYLPLNMTVTIPKVSAAGGSVKVYLHETEIGGTVTESQITTLPGPVTNSSSEYQTTVTTTIPPLPSGETITSALSAGDGSVPYSTLLQLVNQSFGSMAKFRVVYNSTNLLTNSFDGQSYTSTNWGNETEMKFYDNESVYVLINTTEQLATGTESSSSDDASFYLNNSKTQVVCTGYQLTSGSGALTWSCTNNQYVTSNAPNYGNEIFGIFSTQAPNLVLHGSGQKEFEGQSCTELTGGTSLGEEGIVDQINMSTCISDSLDVPLNVTVWLNGSLGGSIDTVKQVYFSQSPTKAQVVTLPGAPQTMTSSYTPSSTTTVTYSTPQGCWADSYTIFNCTDASITSGGQLSFAFNQLYPGTTYFDVKVACTTNVDGFAPSTAEFYSTTSSGAVGAHTLTGVEQPGRGLVKVDGLQCYNSVGDDVSVSPGQPVTGAIWMNASAFQGGGGIVQELAVFNLTAK